jgi:hypothetical protein
LNTTNFATGSPILTFIFLIISHYFHQEKLISFLKGMTADLNFSTLPLELYSSISFALVIFQIRSSVFVLARPNPFVHAIHIIGITDLSTTPSLFVDMVSQG